MQTYLTYRRLSGQSLGFIDDIAFGVQGGTDENNAKELEKMLIKLRGGEMHMEQDLKPPNMSYTLHRHPNKSTQAAIRIANAVIQPSPDARYLGVVFDKQLRFKQHVQQIAKKGSKFGLLFPGLQNRRGEQLYQQTLFTTIVAPRMDYAAIIWHRPRKHGQMNRPPQLSKLESAQRTAMKAILGAFRTTATSALEVETCLLPHTFVCPIRSSNLSHECKQQQPSIPSSHVSSKLSIPRVNTTYPPLNISPEASQTMQQNPWKPSSHMLDHPGGLQILPSMYLATKKQQSYYTRTPSAMTTHYMFTQMVLA
jgi:hypothetical protein